MAPAAPTASRPASNKPDDHPLHHEAPSAASPTPAPDPPATPKIRDSTGFHTDGRVRNPVPTKLQGVTSNMNGNFAVMHIDLTGTKPSDRNAAARRTSEETEAQARRASQMGCQPVPRTKVVWHNDEADSQRAKALDTATPPSTAAAPPSNTPAAPATTGSSSELLQTRMPAPRETKAEQARLLTLLRTLHPLGG